MKAVEVNGISVGYGTHTVINNLSLSVDEGEFVGILGPNGCGKTTLLRAMTRILKPESGAVLVNGKEISSYNPKEFARTLGCVNQHTQPAFSFSVKDIVLMGRNPHLGRLQPLSENDFKIAEKAMEETGISHLADRTISELSGGETQRVMIAKTLAQQPKILLLDEPTNHLDISHQIDILDLIRNLTPEITVVSVLHDLNLASYFCDRLILMESGQIQATGTPEEVLTSERIFKTFAVKMMVYPHPMTGRPYMVPQYGFKGGTGTKKIHVVSGGGSGALLFSTLSAHGFTVTTGVLALNDTDAKFAKMLGINSVTVPPFSPITEEARTKAKRMIEESDAVFVTDLKIGTGNLENLNILLETEKPVYLIGEIEDFTGGNADSIRKELITKGAVPVPDAKTAIWHLLENK